MFEMTETIARKVLEVVDAGLSSGVGNPVPGEMCVEAAVCFALGEKHGDEPSCVAPALRAFKIGLNDAGWSSNAARAIGLRRLAIAQLGTAGTLDVVEFARELSMVTVNQIIPRALRVAAAMKMPKSNSEALEQAAKGCEAAEDLNAASAAGYAASYAASAAGYAASAASYAASAASDKELSAVAESVVQILKDMNTQGSRWLDLAPLAA